MIFSFNEIWFWKFDGIKFKPTIAVDSDKESGTLPIWHAKNENGALLGRFGNNFSVSNQNDKNLKEEAYHNSLRLLETEIALNKGLWTLLSLVIGSFLPIHYTVDFNLAYMTNIRQFTVQL